MTKGTDSFHLPQGVPVTLNFAKRLEDYFSLLYPKSCTKLGVEPTILPNFDSHVVGFFGVSFPSKTTLLFKRLCLAGWLQFLSPVLLVKQEVTKTGKFNTLFLKIKPNNQTKSIHSSCIKRKAEYVPANTVNITPSSLCIHLEEDIR